MIDFDNSGKIKTKVSDIVEVIWPVKPVALQNNHWKKVNYVFYSSSHQLIQL